MQATHYAGSSCRRTNERQQVVVQLLHVVDEQPMWRAWVDLEFRARKNAAVRWPVSWSGAQPSASAAENSGGHHSTLVRISKCLIDAIFHIVRDAEIHCRHDGIL